MVSTYELVGDTNIQFIAICTYNPIQGADFENHIEHRDTLFCAGLILSVTGVELDQPLWFLLWLWDALLMVRTQKYDKNRFIA